jgi:hypothetical protein
MIRWTLLCAILACLCFFGGKQARADGGVSPAAHAERQMIGLLRADWNVARAKRCRDDRPFVRTVAEIPDSRLVNVRRWTRAHVRDARRAETARAECWRSHLWAESSAGRCVAVGESGGNLRARSQPAGTYAGKWQMNRAFEVAYAPGFAQQLGRADRWPEWLQDLAAWRGWQARGWWPWPTTARRCGLL